MRHSAAVVSAEAPDFIEKGTVAKKRYLSVRLRNGKDISNRQRYFGKNMRK